jgi:hypothetical protein
MSERIKWVSACNTHRIDGNAHRILVIKLGDLGINGSLMLIKDLKV